MLSRLKLQCLTQCSGQRKTAVLVVAIVVVWVLGTLLVGPAAAGWYVANRYLPEMAKRLGYQATIGDLDVGYGTVVATHVVVHDVKHPKRTQLLSVERIVAEYGMWRLLFSRQIDAVQLEKPIVRLNTSVFTGRKKTATKERASSLRTAVQIRGGQLEIIDETLHASIAVRDLSGHITADRSVNLLAKGVSLQQRRLSDPVRFGKVRVEGVLMPRQNKWPSMTLDDGAVQLLPHLLFSGIRGRVVPSASQWGIAFEGSYGGATLPLWSAEGSVQPRDRKGVFAIHATSFELARIANLLKYTPLITPERTRVDGDFTVRWEGAKVMYQGEGEVVGVSFFHPRVSREPIINLSLAAKISGAVDFRQRVIDLHELTVRSKKLEATVRARVQRWDDAPFVSVQLTMPQRPCQSLITQLPAALVGDLKGFELDGSFGMDVQAAVDYRNLDALSLNGDVGINRCRVVSAPEAFSAQRLSEAFEHTVESEPEQFLTMILGNDDPHFVALGDISPHVMNALLTTEDAAFFRHRGFISSQFRVALVKNLKAGRFRIGASTITMQMVKNVLLSHEKTLSRKLQELFLTWYLEQNLSKERIFEIYLNAIEFGPGIFGVGRAAHHYFGKQAKDLLPIEAAFLATILPNPRQRYAHYCRGTLTPAWDNFVRRVLTRMYERQRLDVVAFEESKTQQVQFKRDFTAMSEIDCLTRVNELSAAWQSTKERRLKESIMRVAPHQLQLYFPAQR